MVPGCGGQGQDDVLGQVCVPHKVTVAFAGGAAAFVEGPDDQALAAAAVAGGEDAFKIGGVLFELGHDVGAGVAFDAQSVERDPSVIIELKKRAVVSVAGRIRLESHDIPLGNPRHFFNGDIFAGELRPHGSGENRCVARVRFRVQAKHAMSTFGRCHLQQKNEGKRRHAGSLHGRLIKGLTGFATFAV